MKASAEKSSTTTSTPAARTASQPFFAKAGGSNFFEPATATGAPSVQLKLTVNQPGDKFEQEADRMADKIMRMPAPAAPNERLQRQPEDKLQKKEDDKIQKAAAPEEKLQRAEKTDDKLQKKEDDKLQRKGGDGAPAVGASVQSAIRQKTTGGQPLSADVRSYMEPRFGADFSNVRIHNDSESAGLSNQLSARAFTHQNHVFFSRDQYQPGTGEGKQLLAHELTHTIQQGHAIQRSPQVSTTTTPPPIQRWGVQDALDYFAEEAYHIFGFRLLTIVLGFNPINQRATDRSAANILRALIEVIPGGHLITQALDNYGVFNKAGAWVEQKLADFADIGGELVAGLERFLDSLSWKDIFDLGDVWERAKAIFTDPVERLIAFGGNVVTDLLQLVKDALLKPLVALAEGTAGYDLLKAVLGKDPITGEEVPESPDALIRGFMQLIGQEEIYDNLKKGNALAKAYAWFRGALSGLMGFVRAIPGKIFQTLTSLTFQDIITVAGAFTKVASHFASLAGEFLSWGLQQVISLLEILFSVVAPGLMPYLKKAKAAFQTILKNPIGFVNNLVAAGKQGFQLFAAKIDDRLETALKQWIAGPLGQAGVYIPQALTPPEILKLVSSVLGLTWQTIRGKLVKIIPDPVLAGLEKTAAVLVTLIKDGPVAVWQQITGELSELQAQLIAQVTQMVTREVVKVAVGKLARMLTPAGAVIEAILAIYNTVTFFIQKFSQIGRVVASVVDSFAAIAAGQIPGAAKKVEASMAGALNLIIAFLAKFAGLGNIPEKLVGVVKRVRQPLDKGIDKIVAWLGKLLQGVAQVGVPQDPNERLRLGMQAALGAVNRFSGRQIGRAILTPILASIKLRYGFRELEVLPRGRKWAIRGVVNPDRIMDSGAEVPLEESPPGASSAMIQQLLGLRNEGGREIEISPGSYYGGNDLRKTLRAVHPLLLSGNVGERKVAIDQLRLKDKIWTVLQGMIYSPFITEQEQAVRQLRNDAEEPPFLYSLERGGSLLAEQIARGTSIQVISIPTVTGTQIRKGVEQEVILKTAQVNNLEKAIINDLSGNTLQNTSVVITETMVGGGSVDALIKMAAKILRSKRFPNIRFKILALQQTLHTEDAGRGVVEVRHNAVAKVDKTKLILKVAAVPYIIGEDVNYQIARNQATSKEPIIVYKATSETIYAYQIVPLGETTARDIVVDLIEGKYNGRLQNVL